MDADEEDKQHSLPDLAVRARSVQLSAATALGRVAGVSADLAAEVVRLGILPHLVRYFECNGAAGLLAVIFMSEGQPAILPTATSTKAMPVSAGCLAHHAKPLPEARGGQVPARGGQARRRAGGRGGGLRCAARPGGLPGGV